jgi:hypothetical protein
VAVYARAAEIADLEALIEALPARAQTLGPLVHELRERQSKLQRDARREANAELGRDMDCPWRSTGGAGEVERSDRGFEIVRRPTVFCLEVRSERDIGPVP